MVLNKETKSGGRAHMFITGELKVLAWDLLKRRYLQYIFNLKLLHNYEIFFSKQKFLCALNLIIDLFSFNNNLMAPKSSLFMEKYTILAL